MKWKTKERKFPKVGDTRHKVKFAFWPTKCDDGNTRWLEDILVTEEFVKTRSSFIVTTGQFVPRRKWVASKKEPASNIDPTYVYVVYWPTTGEVFRVFNNEDAAHKYAVELEGWAIDRKVEDTMYTRIERYEVRL